jgi:hypothetical protein
MKRKMMSPSEGGQEIGKSMISPPGSKEGQEIGKSMIFPVLPPVP